MPTIHEIAKATNISLKKLRGMEKRGWLQCDPDAHPMVESVLRTFRSGNPLTVAQYVALIEQPGLIDSLGDKAQRARQQISLLDEAPAAIMWADLSFAAIGDAEATARLVEWVQGALPEGWGVPHHWLAVRLLLAVPAHMRHFEIPRLGKVMLAIRKHENFVGWFTIARQGSRNVTRYHRPKVEKGFDL